MRGLTVRMVALTIILFLGYVGSLVAIFTFEEVSWSLPSQRRVSRIMTVPFLLPIVLSVLAVWATRKKGGDVTKQERLRSWLALLLGGSYSAAVTALFILSSQGRLGSVWRMDIADWASWASPLICVAIVYYVLAVHRSETQPR